MKLLLLAVLLLGAAPAYGQESAEAAEDPHAVLEELTVRGRLPSPIAPEAFEEPEPKSFTVDRASDGRQKFVFTRRLMGSENGIRLEEREVRYGDLGRSYVPEEKGRKLRLVFPFGLYAGQE